MTDDRTVDILLPLRVFDRSVKFHHMLEQPSTR
jgi:hypothetical protein